MKNQFEDVHSSADMFVLSYHKTYNLDASITRCTNNFGPYQLPEKLVPKTIIRTLRNLPIPVYGKGTNVRDWISVMDHCEAIDTALEKGQSGTIYNFEIQRIQNFANKYNAFMFITTEDNKVLIVLHDFIQTL